MSQKKVETIDTDAAHLFEQVMSSFNKMDVGEVLTVSSIEPLAPLREFFEANPRVGFMWAEEKLDATTWQVRITKMATKEALRSSCCSGGACG